MELLLNAIWLAVAISLTLVWRLRWLPQLRECPADRRKWQSLVGLICVLALLFPAISLTDDLHPAEFALADTKSLYAVAHSHDSARPAPQPHSPAMGFSGIIHVSRFRLTLQPDGFSSICAPVLVLHESHCGRISGRAPPSLS
ncbi:MAG: hypothetical protein WAN23_05755 [Candidatus Acidiferrales bacterium]